MLEFCVPFETGVWGTESLLEFCLIFENIAFNGEMSLKAPSCHFYPPTWEELKKITSFVEFFCGLFKTHQMG